MTAQTIEFRTEVKQLLDIVIHSLYSHKDIFLRELISNASDAIDKARFESLTDSGILEAGEPWKIRISADKANRTITISDNGIGMAAEEAITALGTIAHSGTREFLKLVESREVTDSPELIGQFGVGFYSAFMVGDRVTVISRKAGQKGQHGVRWESSADGTFTVETVEKEGKGTDVTVHLREGEETYLEEARIRSVVRKYSDFIEHPIIMEVEREKESELKKGETYTVKEDETLNSMKALWLRDRNEVPDSDYDEFYRHLSHDFAAPARVIRYKAEGTTEFTALLFIPANGPVDIFPTEFKIGPALYVRKVQIMDHCADLIPPYLRFVKGVVDSSDLPLNISREMLQSSREVEIIRKSITKKILDTLADMKKSEYEKYLVFFREFGAILKEGIHYDIARKDVIAELLLFETSFSEPGQFVTLGDYVNGMKEGQDAIYYILGASRGEIERSPYLEALREKGYDVLLMTDEIDAFIAGGIPEYKGIQLKSVTRGDITVDRDISEQRERARTEYGKLIDVIREMLSDDVKDVRLSGRLRDSACCLVSDEADLDPRMERLLSAMGRGIPPQKRILEINPSHPLLSVMNEAFKRDRESPLLREYAGLLYDQALILEGSRPKDPTAFTRVVSDLMLGNAKTRLHGD